MKKKLSPRSKKFRPIKLLLLFVAGVLLIVLAWNWYVHYQDKQKFMTLKQDILSLQTEFNKIDSGWIYSEWCHAKGEKFKENEASSCGISLTTKKHIDLAKYESINNITNIFTIGQTVIVNDEIHNKKLNDKKFSYKQSFNCMFAGEKIDNIVTKDVSLSCSSSALDFYFPKTQ